MFIFTTWHRGQKTLRAGSLMPSVSPQPRLSRNVTCLSRAMAHTGTHPSAPSSDPAPQMCPVAPPSVPRRWTNMAFSSVSWPARPPSNTAGARATQGLKNTSAATNQSDGVHTSTAPRLPALRKRQSTLPTPRDLRGLSSDGSFRLTPILALTENFIATPNAPNSRGIGLRCAWLRPGSSAFGARYKNFACRNTIVDAPCA